MNRLSKIASGLIFLGLACAARAETPPVEPALPPFAVARLSISKMGIFLDQNGAFASQIIPNAGPLSKMFLANFLFKVPVDESLNFAGPARIYLMPPLALDNPEMASILPVSDAAKFKKNLASVYGEPVERDGAMVFAIPQGVTQDDKTLLVKIINDKALLANSAEVLKQLEAVATAPANAATPFAGGADAELAVDIAAVKKLYGLKIEGALQIGAYLASENIEGLKKVSAQLETIIKTLWQIDRLELRVRFDNNSIRANFELAVVPLPDSHLADFCAAPPPALKGKNTALLPAGAPFNAAFRIDGKRLYTLLSQFGLDALSGDNILRTLLDLWSGETTLAIEPANRSLLQSQLATEPTPLVKKAGTMQQAFLDGINRQIANSGGNLETDAFVPSQESAEHNGVRMTLHHAGTKANNGKPLVKGDGPSEFMAAAEINNRSFLSLGKAPRASLNQLIDLTQSKAPVSAGLNAAFETPPPGTLAMASANVLELAKTLGADYLPENITPEQIVGGLTDAPIAASVFIADGRMGLRLALPATTTRSLYVVYARLRNCGIDLGDMLGLNALKKANDDKAPGNIPAPPPEK